VPARKTLTTAPTKLVQRLITALAKLGEAAVTERLRRSLNGDHCLLNGNE